MSGMTGMNWLQAGGAAMSLFGGAKSASASRSSAAANAVARTAAADYEARQLEQNAGQSIAAATHAALEKTRLATLVQSRALAVAAAGGGGATDQTIVNLIGKVAGEGAYRSAVALYEGEDRARAMKLEAATRRYSATQVNASESAQANASADAALLKGFGGAFSAGSSLFSKYASKGPSGDAALVAPGWGGTPDNPWYG